VTIGFKYLIRILETGLGSSPMILSNVAHVHTLIYEKTRKGFINPLNGVKDAHRAYD